MLQLAEKGKPQMWSTSFVMFLFVLKLCVQREVVRNPVWLNIKWDNGDAEVPVKDSFLSALLLNEDCITDNLLCISVSLHLCHTNAGTLSVSFGPKWSVFYGQLENYMCRLKLVTKFLWGAEYL